MPIEWISIWAVDGEEKLLKLPSGSVIRDPATTAEMEFYAEILRLRRECAGHDPDQPSAPPKEVCDHPIDRRKNLGGGVIQCTKCGSSFQPGSHSPQGTD